MPLPEHLVILGGGYVGLEFGQMFRRFGSQVTIVNRGPQLLAREDPDITEQVLTILRKMASRFTPMQLLSESGNRAKRLSWTRAAGADSRFPSACRDRARSQY